MTRSPIENSVSRRRCKTEDWSWLAVLTSLDTLSPSTNLPLVCLGTLSPSANLPLPTVHQSNLSAAI